MESQFDSTMKIYQPNTTMPTNPSILSSSALTGGPAPFRRTSRALTAWPLAALTTIGLATAVPVTLLEENFQGLSAGSLNGQNGWSGDTGWTVTGNGNITPEQSLAPPTSSGSTLSVAKSFAFPTPSVATDLTLSFLCGSHQNDTGFVIGGLSSELNIYDVMEARRAAPIDSIGTKALGSGTDFGNQINYEYDVDNDGDLDRFAGVSPSGSFVDTVNSQGVTDTLFTIRLTARYVPGINNDRIRAEAQTDSGEWIDLYEDFGGDNDGVGSDTNFNSSTRDADGFYPIGADFPSGTLNVVFKKGNAASNVQVGNVLVTSEVVGEEPPNSEATLTITRDPNPPGDLTLHLEGTAGASYKLQTNTDLGATWDDGDTYMLPVSPAEPKLDLVIPFPVDPRRFYRFAEVP